MELQEAGLNRVKLSTLNLVIRDLMLIASATFPDDFMIVETHSYKNRPAVVASTTPHEALSLHAW